PDLPYLPLSSGSPARSSRCVFFLARIPAKWSLRRSGSALNMSEQILVAKACPGPDPGSSTLAGFALDAARTPQLIVRFFPVGSTPEPIDFRRKAKQCRPDSSSGRHELVLKRDSP